jgi:hypothetical protein
LLDDTAEGERIRTKVGQKIFRMKNDEFNAPGLVLGYSYAPSPVIADDGTPIPPPTVEEFTPSARPGSRLPHSADESGVPIFDRLSSGMNLVIVGGDDAARSNIAVAADKLDVPLQTIHLSDQLRAVYGARYLLVRPDQHIAWRGDDVPSDPELLLREVTGMTA